MRWRASLAGAMSVGVALALMELAAGLIEGVPSLVITVGSFFVPFVPPVLEDFAIETFGTSDKFVLNSTVAVGTILIGAWSGVVAWRNRREALGIWVGFAALGFLLSLQQPLVSGPRTLVALVIALAAGFGSLLFLKRSDELAQRLASARDAGLQVGGRSAEVVADLARRRFLGALGGLGAGALLAAAGGRALLRGRQRVDLEAIVLPEPVRAAGGVSSDASFAIDGLTPIVVPNADFYRIDTALTVPRVDPEKWTLRIHGMVNREVELTYNDLLRFDMVEQYTTLSCVSNRVGGDLVGNAKWLGVPLTDLLEHVGVRDGGDQIFSRSVDGWTCGFPTELAFDGREPLVAVGMNDEPLPLDHGFPARLVVPGLYGYVSATKWLTEIELTPWDGVDGYWVPRGWAKEGPIKTQSRIDVPGRSATVPNGPTVVAGVAWAPTRGISRVEVRANNGAFVDATISSPLSSAAWVQWRAELDLPEGRHLLEVRATDGNGDTQGAEYVPPRPDGAEGYDVIRVTAI